MTGEQASSTIKHDMPDEKKTYVDFAATIATQFRDFRGNYPRTNVIDLDPEAHHYALSLAITYDNKKEGHRVFHPFAASLSLAGDKERLSRMLKKSKVVFVESTISESSLAELEVLIKSAKEGFEDFPGALYIGGVEDSKPFCKYFSNGNGDHSKK